MKKWNKILYVPFFGIFFSISAYSNELIKVGIYDFQDTVREMSDEPFLRKQSPDALGAPLFVALMLKDRASKTARPSKDPWTTQSENYAKYFVRDALWKGLQGRMSNYQKSRTMRNNLVLGLSLAHQYRGYSIILKSQAESLFSDTNLSADIASVLSDYLSRGPQEYAGNEAESTEEVPTGTTVSDNTTGE